jgi:DNA-binding NarL/FixJ family response regulator
VLDAITSGARVSAFDAHVKTSSGSRKWVNISVFGADLPSGRVAVHILHDIDGQRHIYSLSRKIAALVHRLPGPFEPSDAELTPRERKVLQALARGASTADIAGELVVSQATVRNHIQHILRKLGVHTRLEAVTRAARGFL